MKGSLIRRQRFKKIKRRKNILKFDVKIKRDTLRVIIWENLTSWVEKKRKLHSMTHSWICKTTCISIQTDLLSRSNVEPLSTVANTHQFDIKLLAWGLAQSGAVKSKIKWIPFNFEYFNCCKSFDRLGFANSAKSKTELLLG